MYSLYSTLSEFLCKTLSKYLKCVLLDCTKTSLTAIIQFKIYGDIFWWNIYVITNNLRILAQFGDSYNIALINFIHLRYIGMVELTNFAKLCTRDTCLSSLNQQFVAIWFYCHRLSLVINWTFSSWIETIVGCCTILW